MMDPLELKLKRALEPKEPPAGFADRVVAGALEEAAAARQRRAQAAPDRSLVGWWFGWLFRPAWRAALAGGLACLLLVAGVLAYRQRQERVREERVRGEKAAAEAILALEIASSKLNRVRYVLDPESRQSREKRGKGSHESQN